MRSTSRAVRVNASVRKTMLGRSKRVLSYDARFSDGRVDKCVDVDEVLQGARFPADSWVTRKAADAACPRIGVGTCVTYATRGSAARWTTRLTMPPHPARSTTANPHIRVTIDHVERRAGEGTRPPNRLFTRQVRYQLRH